MISFGFLEVVRIDAIVVVNLAAMSEQLLARTFIECHIFSHNKKVPTQQQRRQTEQKRTNSGE